MESEIFLIFRVVIFILVSVFLMILSWRSLHNIRSHGFYRFFAFEGVLTLFLLNFSFWFKTPYSPLQLISWLCLFSSLVLVAQGFYVLKMKGGFVESREGHTENLNFENTTNLVTEGIYKYIRHPMYCSLVLLTWGLIFKNVTPVGVIVGLVSIVLLIATAKAEENENIIFFGLGYQEYIKRTKMFIPFIF